MPWITGGLFVKTECHWQNWVEEAGCQYKALQGISICLSSWLFFPRLPLCSQHLSPGAELIPSHPGMESGTGIKIGSPQLCTVP